MLLVWDPCCIFLVTLHISQFNSQRKRMIVWFLKEGATHCGPRVPMIIIINHNNLNNNKLI